MRSLNGDARPATRGEGDPLEETHGGQPIVAGSKCVAQAGVLRRLPPGKLFQPSVFRVGPGVQALANEAETMSFKPSPSMSAAKTELAASAVVLTEYSK